MQIVLPQQAVLTLDDIEPNPKNPIIAAFFGNIGYADQLGSGVRNLFKYSEVYSGKEPEFVEGDVFRIIVPLDEALMNEGTTQSNLIDHPIDHTQSNQSTIDEVVHNM